MTEDHIWWQWYHKYIYTVITGPTKLPIHRRNAKITILAVAPISYLVHEVTIHDGRPSILLLFTFKLSLQDLIEELKSELGGNYETVCIGLCLSPAEFDAKCLHNAIKVIISKTSSFWHNIEFPRCFIKKIIHVHCTNQDWKPYDYLITWQCLLDFGVGGGETCNETLG